MGGDCFKNITLFKSVSYVSECECHGHTDKCTYNADLGHGVCDNCQHNTTGNNCQSCLENYFRNHGVEIDDPKTCLCM